MKIKIYFLILVIPFLLSGCLDTDGEIKGTASDGDQDLSSILIDTGQINPGTLPSGVMIGDVAQLPAPLNGSACAANEIIEWDGSVWRCIPTPAGVGSIPATSITPGTFQTGVVIPADQIGAETLPAGVMLPTNQLLGTINPTAQIAAGALNASTTVDRSQLRSNCTNTQILQSDASGNFSCVNMPASSVTSVHGRTGVVSAVAGDYTAAEVTNVAAGNIAATEVQAAINELDAEKLALTGGTMSGAINMGTNVINNLGTPVLGTDATTKAYVDTAVAGAAGSPGGATTQVQFNNAGSFDGDSNFVWDDANARLGVGTALPITPLHVSSVTVQPALFESAGATSSALFRDSGTGVTTAVGLGSAGNDLRLVAGNLERVRIDSTGNVGIGTIAPAVELDVDDGVVNASAICDENNANCIDLSAGVAGDNLGNHTATAKLNMDGNTLVGAVADTQGVHIASGGNVGIGTTAPADKLDIKGSITLGEPTDESFIRGRKTSGSVLLTAGIDSTSGPIIELRGNTAGGGVSGNLDLVAGDGASGEIRFLDYNGTTWDANMVISKTGNVGIGTTAPGSKLHVSDNGNPYIRVTDADDGVEVALQAEGAGLGLTGTITNHPFRIVTNNVEKIRVLENGNVGIGTTNPAVELDVDDGVINASAICDENNANCIDLSSGVGGGGSGTLTSITAGAGLSGGTITSSGTIAVASGGISTAMLASGAVDSTAIADNSVSVDDLDFASTNGITTPNLAAAPAAPAVGQQYFNTTTNRLMVYNGTAWTKLGGSETSAIMPGWPDAILCGPNDPRVFYLAGDVGSGTTDIFYKEANSAPSDIYLRYNSDGSWDSAGNTSYPGCINKDISTLVSEGRAKFFGNDIGSIAQDDDNDTKIMVEKNADEDKIRFDTAGVESMIIDEDGNVGIGTTSPVSRLEINGSEPFNYVNIERSTISVGAVGYAMGTDSSNRAAISQAPNSNDLLFFIEDPIGGAANRMVIRGETGNVGIGTTSPTHPLHMGSGAHVTTAGVWTDASDVKLKENIQPLDKYGLDTVLDLEPKTYTMKKGKEKQIGFIAQDVNELVPEVVSTKGEYWGISYGQLTTVIVNAVKDFYSEFKTTVAALFDSVSENKQEIAELKKENTELKSRLDRLEKMMMKSNNSRMPASVEE